MGECERRQTGSVSLKIFSDQLFEKYVFNDIIFFFMHCNRNAETWPKKLMMQLLPRALIGNIGQGHIENSKTVVFFASDCDGLKSLINMMSDDELVSNVH